MRKIVGYIREFWKEDFHLGTYLATTAFLASAIVFNYATGFTDTFIYRQPDGFGRLIRWMGFVTVPYISVIALQWMMGRQASGLRSMKFWAALLLAILMVSITAWSPWHKTLATMLFPKELSRWGLLVLWNLKRLVFMFIPMFLYWWTMDRHESKFYGLFAKPKNLAPYFWMLLIMLPLIVVASFQPDFLKSYPQYHAGNAEARVGVSPWLTGFTFELVYGADFAIVEQFYRGFLVIGMVKWLGPRAVLPMVAMYCFIHFGKPAGEAIASVLGGYLLGVIAYYSRSIWGGIVVHMGIAWMMEAAAYLQKAFH